LLIGSEICIGTPERERLAKSGGGGSTGVMGEPSREHLADDETDEAIEDEVEDCISRLWRKGRSERLVKCIVGGGGGS